MKFIVDAQLPPALAKWLVRHGSDAVHVEELGLRDADDADIKQAATHFNAVIVTKDRDFAPEGQDVRIVWIRTGNVSNHILFERMQSAWPNVLKHLADGAEIVEIR